MALKQAGTEFVAFDLSDELLRLVHAKLTNLKREVLNLTSRDVHGLSDEEVSGLVKDSVTAFTAVSPRFFICVPQASVITRSIEIPSKDPAEIREIVNLQASRHTPYARAEIIIDILNLGVVRENYTKVLLVIVPRDIVNRQTRILEKAGFNAEKVFFPPEALAMASAKILGVEHSPAPLALVHMDAALTTFSVIQGPKLLFVRGIALGTDALLDDREASADRFHEELAKSLESYTADEAGPAPTAWVLTGAAGENDQMDAFFAEAMALPVKHLAYFKHFPIAERARGVAAASAHLSFFHLIAPLLLHDRVKVDLVSEERKLRLQLERRARDIMKTALLSVAVLTLIFTLFLEKLYFMSRYLDGITARYKPICDQARDLEQLFAKTQLVKGYLLNRGSSIEALSELYDALPGEIRLSSVKYEAGKQLTVKGTSRKMPAAFAFVTALEKSSKFKNVRTKYLTTRSEAGQDVADFEITANIEVVG